VRTGAPPCAWTGPAVATVMHITTTQDVTERISIS
jgi:hypothetical protein